MRRVCRVGVWTVAALLQVALAYGQTTATIRGRVRDAQAAPVAAATVTVTGRDTGLTRVVPTSGDGSFVVANLPPAVVDLTVSASGFAEAKRSGLVLEVGQTVAVDVDLSVAGVQESVAVSAGAMVVDTTRSVVDAVIPATAIEALPLNGRNFLELALLVPGNAPAPNFDPTKSNTVVISSAGQLGRGGNITIDGADNNDDVVGGPLQNVTQESVQEFQIATNRFTRRVGPLGVLGHQRRDQVRQRSPARVGVDLRARQRWQGAAGDLRPIERRHAAVRSAAVRRRRRRSARAGPGVLVRRGRVPQPGRRRAGRRARRGRAHHPPVVRAGAARRPARLGAGGLAPERPPTRSSFATRASSADDTGASSLDRAIGSASSAAAQPATPITPSSAPWTRVLSARRCVNAATVSFSTFDNTIAPVAPGPQLTFPSMLGRLVVPRAAGHRRRRGSRWPTPSRWSRGAHSMRARRRVAARGRRLRPRRVPGRPHRVRRGLRRPSITTATAGWTTTTCCSRSRCAAASPIRRWYSRRRQRPRRGASCRTTGACVPT